MEGSVGGVSDRDYIPLAAFREGTSIYRAEPRNVMAKEFWMRAASQSSWQLVQGYGTSATYDWNSTGAAAGTVYFGVWTRDANSTASSDAVASTPITVT